MRVAGRSAGEAGSGTGCLGVAKFQKSVPPTFGSLPDRRIQANSRSGRRGRGDRQGRGARS
jgi:hypothetical protein